MIERFKKEVSKIDRKGIDSLLDYLDRTGFYKAPASTRYHLASDGGLLEHSLNVLDIARKLNTALGEPCADGSIVICSLFHDLGKSCYFGKDFYSKKPLLKNGKETELQMIIHWADMWASRVLEK